MVSEADHRFDEGEEPSSLGAAATLPVGRGARREGGERDTVRRRPKSRRSARRSDAGLPADRSTDGGIEYVWEPHRSSMPPLGPYVRSLWGRRRFLAELARADLLGGRASTVLGGLWGVLDPLIQAAIYYFLFTIIRGGGDRPDNFLPALIAGVLLFTLIRAALNDGGRSILKAKTLMLNSTFPRALLPLAAIYKSLVEFAPAVVVYAVIHVVSGAPVHVGLLYLPVLFVMQLVLSVGLAMLVATLTVYVRDMVNVINYTLRILMFASPIIYPLDLLEQSSNSFVRDGLVLQPVFSLFASYQTIFLGSTPDPARLVQVLIWSVFFFVLGSWAFLSRERSFSVRL